jgi:ABC-type uncharacterized transport system involved in gliding motility auxiliary subunit
MKITPKIRRQIQLQSSVFIVLLLVITGLLAWFSTRYTYQADWTMDNRHTLSDVSQQLLEQMSDPITITAYVADYTQEEQDLQELIKNSIERYQRYKPNLSVRFVNPDLARAEVESNNIRRKGELLIQYQGRTEHLLQQQFSEQELTETLHRLARTQQHAVAFLEGHGEPSPMRSADNDMSKWAQQLKKRGITVTTLDFAKSLQIPNDLNALIIANPKNTLLPAEVFQISDFLDKGGNLFWLLKSAETLQGLAPLAEKLGLTVQPGIVIDPSSQLFSMGLQRPDITSITSDNYGEHPITEGFYFRTLLLQATALKVEPIAGWEATTLMFTHPQAWLETSDITDVEVVEFNEEVDITGPLEVAVALNRVVEQETAGEMTSSKQRVVIVGESDFLSNAYINLEGNLDMGTRMLDWLVQEDVFLDIPARIPSDRTLELSDTVLFFIQVFFLIVLPLSLISTGVLTWLQRTRA